MKVKEIKNNYKEEWDSFFISENGSFLQSWEWGEFQKTLNNRIWRFGIYNEKDEAESFFMVIKILLPKGFNWLYIPHLFIHNDKNVNDIIISKVNEIAKKEKSLFFKTDPLLINLDLNKKRMEALGLKPFSESIQPKVTIILDLNKSEEELLKEMHQKTRYNINLAKKKGVNIIFSKEREYIDEFISLTHKMASRQKIKTHSSGYYKNLIQEAGFALVLAEHNGKIIAANLLSIFGQKAVYVHGSSDYNYRKLMAPHLLQWESILYAQKKGCRYYDLWGIQSSDKQTKKWAGFTRFKKGFSKNINVTEYIGIYIKVYRNFLYLLYLLVHKLRNF